MCDNSYEIDDVVYCYTNEELENLYTKKELMELEKYKIKLKATKTQKPKIFKQDINIFNDGITKCNLISSRKTKFYTHTTTDYEKILPGYKELDYTIYKNCCNCIAILFYTKSSLCEEYSNLKYLTSMTKTILNVRKYLPNFVVRLYLDSSVYKAFEKCSYDLVSKLFENLFLYDNLEIYTITCRSKDAHKEITRIYRTLILKDNSVNIKVIRDADGIVSKLDAHNIKVFSNSKYLFYLPPISPNFDINIDYIEVYEDMMPRLYSKWLNDYVYNYDGDFFKNNYMAYNILCGLYASKIKFTEDYYDDCAIFVKKNIKEKFYYAFDELFLLELHKNILSYSKHEIDTYIHYEKFNSYVMSQKQNITTITTEVAIDAEITHDELELSNLGIIIPGKQIEDIFNEKDYVPPSYTIYPHRLCILLNYIDDNLVLPSYYDNMAVNIILNINEYVLKKLKIGYLGDNINLMLLTLLNLPYAGKIKSIGFYC